MKKLLFSLLTIGLFFSFSACGSDDNKAEEFFTGDCKQTISLESGPAEGLYTTPTSSAALDDLLKNSSGYGSPVSSGVLYVTGSNTAVKIVGLPAGTALKDFKLTINGIEQNFGEISNERSNVNLYTTDYSNYFSRAFNQMISDKKLETKVSFTPTVHVTNAVSLQIVFSGRFSYWVKL